MERSQKKVNLKLWVQNTQIKEELANLETEEEMALRVHKLEAERAHLAETVKILAEEKEKLENEEKALTTIKTRKRKMRGLKMRVSALHNGDKKK